MVEKLQLKDLDIGKTDCKNELLRGSEKQKEKFKHSFMLPENVNVNKFLQRENFEYYFITGLKGTGKTCLLRYVGLKIDEMSHLHSSFILFKSDLRGEKSEFARASNNVTKIEESVIKSTKTPDYDLLWDWIIHKHIVDTIEKKNIDVFKRDIYWENYSTCVKAVMEEDKRRLIPKIKNGNIEISTHFIAIATKVKLDLGFSSSTKTVKFEQLIANINRLYKSLTHSNETLYILFDELELTPSPRKFYNRDAKLIRDLIDTIERFNAISLSRNGSVFLIAAIRSEVLNSLAALGKEINKSNLDFGVEISWKHRNKKTIDHPLLKLLEKRIQAAEFCYGEEQVTSDVWKTYFPETINGLDSRRYILFQTWYKPRDIIRLLLCAKEAYPNERMFSQEVFDSIKNDYSEKSWEELCEELRLSHNIDELAAIQQILHEYQREFSYTEICDHITNLRKTNKSIDLLFKKYSLNDILDELYRVGILGNACDYKEKRYYRFIYKGDNRILFDQKIIVHRGLWPCLCV